MQDKEGMTVFAIFANEHANSVITASAVSWLPRRHRIRSRLSTREILVMVLALATAIAVNAAPTTSLRVNLSASMPRGIYTLTSRAPTRGALIAFCVGLSAAALAAERRYLSAGSCPDGTEPLLKPVLAVEGDIVTTTERSVAVNSVLIAEGATRTVDSDGRPLPHHPFGRHELRRGELWVFSPARRSWDSRYFGPVRAEQVISTVEPVFTIG
jgi:conjugative transfer signal peptidase TraF